MVESGNPAAATLAASLYQRLSAEQQLNLFDLDTRARLSNLVTGQQHHPVSVADVSHLKKRLSSARKAVGPAASPWSIIVFR